MALLIRAFTLAASDWSCSVVEPEAKPPAYAGAGAAERPDDKVVKSGAQLRCVWAIVRVLLKDRLSHPRHFALSTAVNSLDVIVPTLAFAALVHTFGTLGGWNFGEVALLLGTSNVALGISLLVVGAFDSFLFIPILRSGQFESGLTRPISPVLFLAAANLRLYRLGRVIAAFGVVIIGIVMIDHHVWSVVAVLPSSLLFGSLILSALWFLDSSAGIVLGQANDMTRTVPFAASEMAFFPQGLFPSGVRFFAQFVLGLGAATYLPIAFALDKGPHLGWFSLFAGPLVAIVILLFCRLVWSRAVAHFEMAGAP